MGIQPIPLQWGAADPNKRGPVIASRHPSSIKIRNAIGAYVWLLPPFVAPSWPDNRRRQGGSYSVYRALAVAIGALDPMHRPDFTNTEPVVEVGPFPQWGDKKKIVAMDPWGHLAPFLFSETIKNDNGQFGPPPVREILY